MVFISTGFESSGKFSDSNDSFSTTIGMEVWISSPEYGAPPANVFKVSWTGPEWDTVSLLSNETKLKVYLFIILQNRY